MANPKQYSAPTVKGAILLNGWLTNKHQLSLIAFNIDVQTLFKFSNQRYQRKYDCVIGHGDHRMKLEADLELLISENGPYLSSLLSKSHCVDTLEQAEAILNFAVTEQSFDVDGCKSLSQYEESFVVYENMILHGNDVPDVDDEIEVVEQSKDEDDNEDVENDPNLANVDEDDVNFEDDVNIEEPLSEMDVDVSVEDASNVNVGGDSQVQDGQEQNTSGQDATEEAKKKKKKKQMTFEPLSTIREPYIKEILKNLDHHLPSKLMKEFDLFDHRKWLTDVSVSVQFSQSWRVLKKLLSYFNIKYKPEFFKNFKGLVEKLMDPNVYPDWCKHEESPPSLFWQIVLGSGIEIDPDLKQLIRTLLVIPVGSSEAERAFRYYRGS